MRRLYTILRLLGYAGGLLGMVLFVLGKQGGSGKAAAPWLPAASAPGANKADRSRDRSGPASPHAAPGRRGQGTAAATEHAPARRRSPWLPVPQDASAPALVDPAAAREAARYAEPIASRELILQVLAASDGPMDAGALARVLSVLR